MDENEPMERTNMNSPLPEITLKTTTDISNQSISQSGNRRVESIKDDRLIEKTYLMRIFKICMKRLSVIVSFML
ncbi:hypothetical protein [Anaerosalibacter sp. Marseille-P3206]|uniref:hypothetical protein n=1 Tax=Anaerosalibacter sp. Marseille-P3206 TaxID=1871005 RepID=UPI00098654C1|nr:hypothetical protein [Anaerosalibacter sp. Marseille-P3206]